MLGKNKENQADFNPQDFGAIDQDVFLEYANVISILKSINNMGEQYYEIMDDGNSEQNSLERLDSNILGQDIVDTINQLFDEFNEKYQVLLSKLDDTELQGGISDLKTLAIIKQMKDEGDISDVGDVPFYNTDDLEQSLDSLRQAGRVDIPEKTTRINPDSFLRRPIFNKKAKQNRHQAEAVLARLDDARDKHSNRREQMDKAYVFINKQVSNEERNDLQAHIFEAIQLLSLAEKTQDTLHKAYLQGDSKASSLSHSDELVTPLQASAAERCLLELKKYFSKGIDFNKRIIIPEKLMQAGNELEQALNIKELIRETTEKIDNMLIELRTKMARKNTEINGINTLLDSLVGGSRGRDEQVQEVREQVAENLRLLMAEYKNLEREVLPKVLNDLKNPLQAEGLAMTMVNGNVDDLYLNKLTDFNKRLTNLDDSIGALKELLNISQEPEQITSIPESRMLPSAEHVQPSEAREIMGEKYFHDEKAIAKTFGMPLELIPEAPPIPFSKQELIKAKEDGCMLIYRASRIVRKGSVPFTIQQMHNISKDKVGKLLYSGDNKDAWYNKPGKEEVFFISETCRDGWALVQMEPLQNSTNHDFLEQTALLAEDAQRTYSDIDMPAHITEAINEFNNLKQELAMLLSNMKTEDWTKEQKVLLANRLASLKINQLMRRNTTEAIFDMAVHFANSDERTLESVIYDWTITVSSFGPLVCPGFFDSDGASVSYGWPCYRLPGLAVVVSRSVGNLSLVA